MTLLRLKSTADLPPVGARQDRRSLQMWIKTLLNITKCLPVLFLGFFKELSLKPVLHPLVDSGGAAGSGAGVELVSAGGVVWPVRRLLLLLLSSCWLLFTFSLLSCSAGECREEKESFSLTPSGSLPGCWLFICFFGSPTSQTLLSLLWFLGSCRHLNFNR